MVYRGGNASAEISHTTFYDNLAGRGGAIYGWAYSYVYDGGAAPILSPTIVHTTFTRNSTPTGSGGALFFTVTSSDGGTGVQPPAPVSAPALTASILWGNTAHSSNPNYQQFYTASGVSRPWSHNIEQPVSGTSGNPLLAPLQDNGGPTPTVLPGTGSPAIDSLACLSGVTDDQHGTARPQGAWCDKGAVEISAQASAPLSLAAATRNGAADLTWQPPHSQGLSAVTGYTVTATLNGAPAGSCSATAPATACTISGLVNGTAYQFTVVAANGAGAGIASPAITATPQFRATDPCTSTTVLHAAPAAVGLADGSSWANAATLQGALALAHANTDPGQCQEIRIQQGVYKPTDTVDRSISFAINRPLRLLGGYTGNPAAPDERVLLASNTVLSGDIDGNDLGAAANGGITAVARFTSSGAEDAGNQLKGGNSQHVITIGGVPGQDATGGPYTFDDSLGSYTLIEGVTITGGLATGGNPPEANNGGGLHCNARGAGAVCSPALRHVAFIGNVARTGGALYNGGYLPLGGGWVGGTSSPDIRWATFSGNSATRNGGAIYNVGYFGTSSPTIRHATFSGNVASDSGGAIANRGNTSYGPNANPATASPDIAFTTFSGNQAIRGGAMHSEKGDAGTSTPRIAASIVWGNTGQQQINSGTGTSATVEGSIVQGGFVGGTDILSADPQIGLLQDNGGATPTMLPAPGGPAIDAVACGAEALDQRGVARPQGSGATPCDIGAVEYRYSGGAPVAQYPLTITTAGSVGADGLVNGQALPFTTQYEAGTTVTLTVTPNAGSQFVGWAASCSGTGDCTLVMDQPHVASANFGLVSFPITINVTHPAGGSVAGCAASAAQGSTYTCTPTANTGHSVSFTGCDSASGGTCTIGNVQGPVAIGVTFTPDAHQISGTITGLRGGAQVTLTNHSAGTQTLGNGAFSFATAYGASYAITATAPAGHTCTVNDGSGTVAGDVTGVQVACAVATYAITGAAQPAIGGGMTCPAAPIAHGGSAQCTATAQPGWRFKAFDAASGCTTVSGAACGIAPVQAAHTVTAQFEPHFEGATQPASGTGGTGSATFTGGGPTCRFDTSATGFVPAPAQLPAGQTLPQGMFGFKLIGCDASTVTLRVTWPQPIGGYVKHGKAAGTDTDDSYFAPANLHISGHTATFTVQDGQLGDDDWTVNGEIVDPTGPLAAPTGAGGAHAIPTLSAWGALLLSLLLGLAGWRGFQAKLTSSARQSIASSY
jgi:predicted outer membrane repeat protein